LEDDEIERQLKCKKCDVGLCILRYFEEYHTKARSSQMTRVGGWGVILYIYMHEADKQKKVCTLNFTIFKNNI
jgi:hypothetical protein